MPRRQLWAKADLKAIKQHLPDELPPALKRRAEKAIDDLNQSPLMARFRELVEREGLPISEAEIKLLTAIRGVRNDAVHGRPATPPPPADLDYATAIVAASSSSTSSGAIRSRREGARRELADGRGAASTAAGSSR